MTMKKGVVALALGCVLLVNAQGSTTDDTRNGFKRVTGQEEADCLAILEKANPKQFEDSSGLVQIGDYCAPKGCRKGIFAYADVSYARVGDDESGFKTTYEVKGYTLYDCGSSCKNRQMGIGYAGGGPYVPIGEVDCK